MKSLLLLLLIFISASAQKESCYTIQLSTNSNTPKSRADLLSHKLDKSCQIYTVGNFLAIRCGCYKNKDEAKNKLGKFTQSFNDACVVKIDPKKRKVFSTVTTTNRVDTCYSVEISRTKTLDERLKNEIESQSDKSCLALRLKNYKSLRCGCYKSKKDAKGKLNSLKENYKEATIKVSYAYRFDNIKKSDINSSIVIEETKKEKKKKKKIFIKKSDTNTTIKIEEKKVIEKLPLTPKIVKMIEKKIQISPYEQAKIDFKEKKYKQTIQNLKKAFSDYNNPQLHLLWAKSAEILEHENETMAAYERVLIYDSNNTQAKTALLKIYKKTGRKKLVAELNNINKKKKKVKIEKKKSLDILVEMAGGHDSNINISPKIEKKATSFNRFSGRISYQYNFVNRKGFYLKSDLKGYVQQNFSYDEYNILLGSIEAGIGFHNSKYSVYIPFAYDTLHYLTKDLLKQIRVTPSVTIPLRKTTILNMNFNYAKREYIQKIHKPRDDNSVALGFVLYQLFEKNYLYFGNKYEIYNANKHTDTVYIEKDIYNISMGTKYFLHPKISFNLDASFTIASYNDEARNDKSKTIALRANYHYAGKNQFFISAEYLDNSSTDTEVEFSKNIIMGGLKLCY